MPDICENPLLRGRKKRVYIINQYNQFINEYHTYSNAAADPNGTEANATTGFVTIGSLGTFISQSSVVDVGSYAILGDSNVSVTNTDGFRMDLSALPVPLTVGLDYRISFRCRHLGSGGNWFFCLSNNPTLATASQFQFLNNTQTTFFTISWDFTFDPLVNRYFGAREGSATNDGGVYLDNLSIIKI